MVICLLQLFMDVSLLPVIFLFRKDKRTVAIPEKEKISIKVQLKAVMQNNHIFWLGWTGVVWIYLIWKKCRYFILFYLCRGKCFLLYNIFYVYYHSVHYWCSMLSAVFRKLNNKGRNCIDLCAAHRYSMLAMYFFNVKESPVAFYALAGLRSSFSLV